LLAGNDHVPAGKQPRPGGVRHILLQEQDTVETMCFRQRIALADAFDL
jgi:hypothetical protein